MTQGKFIVIEGTDCSGKETQTKKLIEKIEAKGLKCRHMTFPRYNKPTGRIIGSCYLGKDCESWFGEANSVDPRVASLYYAADRLDAQKEIKEYLNRGETIICDRYVESNLGHQGGKITDPEKRNELIGWIYNLEYIHNKLVKPDKVIFLYMPYEIGIELKKTRQGKADGHESNPEHLKNAETSYLELAQKFNWDKIDCAPDGQLKTIEEIHNIIWNKIKYLF
ncbi:dTMP kinase [Candidatus Woesearchaeota archaeon]|nr:dTMP kinase [Candidatus Woesearchaeota archaeon]